MIQLFGAIGDKFNAVGGVAALGEPHHQEAPTADGIGRFVNFTGHLIIWHPNTGAFHVFGGILERYNQVGRETSFLGYPVSDEGDFPDGGRTSQFQGGGIYWWPDTGAIDMNETLIEFTGINCFGTTSGPGSDEVYTVIGVNAPNRDPISLRSQVQGDVDGGDSRFEPIGLYRGPPAGLVVTMVLMENDFGNPDHFTGLMTEVVKAGTDQLKTLIKLIPKVGPILGFGAGVVFDKLNPIIGGALNNLFHPQDDVIGTFVLSLSARDCVLLSARTPTAQERNINFHIASHLLTGGGSSYKVYARLAAV